MARPSGLQQHLELEEDVRPLTDTGSAAAARQRHFSTVTSIECNVSRGKCTILFTLAVILAVYTAGSDKGHELAISSSGSGSNSKPLKGYVSAIANSSKTPTYQPTGK